jgi:hypothetical protein
MDERRRGVDSEKRMKRSAVTVLLFVAAACSSLTSGDSSSSRRISGVGGDVHVTARLASARVGEPIAIQYTVANERPAPITIADVAPQTIFDAETHTATVKIGAAQGGSKPSLIRLAPGEKKSFRAEARLETPDAEAVVRLQVHFVDDGRPESVYTNATAAYLK